MAVLYFCIYLALLLVLFDVIAGPVQMIKEVIIFAPVCRVNTIHSRETTHCLFESIAWRICSRETLT